MGKLYSLIYYVFPKNVKCLNLDSYQILFFSMIKQPMSLKILCFYCMTVWCTYMCTCTESVQDGSGMFYHSSLYFLRQISQWA